MKKLTGAILLAFFACFLIGGTIRAQTPPPGTTVTTSLSGIVEKTADGLVLRDKDMNMTFELTGKDVSKYVGKKIAAIGQLTFKEGGKKIFEVKQVTDAQ
ncbi:MAG: hypothetical protein OEW45_03860 [Deltaproteobacteria bacterium]|nr:hypothetical protein [Deltaproteobacteria bacterium]